MSWNKNTINFSEVDSAAKWAKRFNIPHKLSTMGTVVGMGLNDIIDMENSVQYDIRRLEIGDIVLLERMERHPDCDMDDYLVSVEFSKKNEPKNWKYIYNVPDLSFNGPYGIVE